MNGALPYNLRNIEKLPVEVKASIYQSNSEYCIDVSKKASIYRNNKLKANLNYVKKTWSNQHHCYAYDPLTVKNLAKAYFKKQASLMLT